jgi:ribosomal protein L37AE/L43A
MGKRKSGPEIAKVWPAIRNPQYREYLCRICRVNRVKRCTTHDARPRVCLSCKEQAFKTLKVMVEGSMRTVFGLGDD